MQHDAMQAALTILNLLHNDLSVSATDEPAGAHQQRPQPVDIFPTTTTTTADDGAAGPDRDDAGACSPGDAAAADRHWEEHLRRNDSCIVRIFDFQQRSSQSWPCPNKCAADGSSSSSSSRTTSHVFEVANALSLPLHHSSSLLSADTTGTGTGGGDGGPLSLSASLRHYLASESPEGAGTRRCEGCGGDVPMAKQLQICRAPKVLCVQFKRYRQNALGEMQRIDDVVQFPEEIFLSE